MEFMNFHPNTNPFLDHAWTTVKVSKPSKPSRKQNRCCDQCRKGKRACDAAVLEDGVLDRKAPNADFPTIFHYSDAFGPLAQCSNCQRTRKVCTFKWLRSQRGAQAAPIDSVVPPSKKRRTQSSTSTRFDPTFVDMSDGYPAAGASLVPPNGDLALMDETTESHSSAWNEPLPLSADFEGNETPITNQYVRSDASLDTLSESIIENCEPYNPRSSIKRSRRRRRSSSGPSNRSSGTSSNLTLANDILVSSNKIFITEGLLKIYHDSFENALACWLIERTCPYSTGAEQSAMIKGNPGWNRIYHRVFRLDRLASPIRGRNLSYSEDKAASRAINLAIFSFATQWAQSSRRSKSEYSNSSDLLDSIVEGGMDMPEAAEEFDRKLQVSAWHEARAALRDAADIDSFRVVLAQIVFSLTQRPIDAKEASQNMAIAGRDHTHNSQCRFGQVATPNQDTPTDGWNCVGGSEEWKSKLDSTLEGDGPPIHLEQGLRLIHSLRSRMTLAGVVANASRQRKMFANAEKSLPDKWLDNSDKDTVDLLFWLGVMFDTLSSVMHKRPLVVSDEDSDVYTTEAASADLGPQDSCIGDPGSLEDLIRSTRGKGLWDDFLFTRQHMRFADSPIRWPCSYEQAANLLCDAAPVKVLLFRKISRIQTLLSRSFNSQRLRVEQATAEAFEVYQQWNSLYAPFFRDCIEYHDSLPAQIQSWYICLVGHWHLATLLLADLLETIGASSLGMINRLHMEEQSHCGGSNCVAALRRTNCFALSDLARCACPRDNASFPNSGEFHFAVNQGALLTEPWTAVLIRAFAKAGSDLLDLAETLLPDTTTCDASCRDEVLLRAEHCCQALFYLGRKSDFALSAARILGHVMDRTKKMEERDVPEIGNPLEGELWEGIDDPSALFGWDSM